MKTYTTKEQIQEIHKVLTKNTDYVGNGGMLHVQMQVSFLNMLGLVFKFMVAVVIMSPFAAAAIYGGIMAMGFLSGMVAA